MKNFKQWNETVDIFERTLGTLEAILRKLNDIGAEHFDETLAEIIVPHLAAINKAVMDKENEVSFK